MNIRVSDNPKALLIAFQSIEEARQLFAGIKALGTTPPELYPTCVVIPFTPLTLTPLQTVQLRIAAQEATKYEVTNADQHIHLVQQSPAQLTQSTPMTPHSPHIIKGDFSHGRSQAPASDQPASPNPKSIDPATDLSNTTEAHKPGTFGPKP